jgi:nucleotide-binding universal stress UspA family protein
MHPQTRRVVVGVDGSPRTVAALRWAATEALRRDAELHAVLAWGDTYRPASYAPVTDAGTPAECARRAGERLAEAVRAAFGAAPPVPVHELVDERAPVPALLGHARDADLLVLATRGAAGNGPGSITMACLRQPPCAVVVLPDAVTAPTGPTPTGADAAAR